METGNENDQKNLIFLSSTLTEAATPTGQLLETRWKQQAERKEAIKRTINGLFSRVFG